MLRLLVIILTLSSQTSVANEIYIIQSGDNFDFDVVQDGSNNSVAAIDTTSVVQGDNLTLRVDQIGDNNVIQGNVDGANNTGDLRQESDDNFQRVSVVGASNSVTVYQGRHSDGTHDGEEDGDHEAYWTVTGSNNTVASYQTDTNRASGGAGHHLANVVDGDYNTVTHTQKGKAGHDGFVEIEGDSNTVDLYQRGNGGQQWADITLTGDGHTVDATQRGTMAHSFELDLTNGGGAYSVDSNQTTNNTTTSKTYSLTGICTNSGGCSVSVTQN